ncbi:MAG: hypothetical protein ACPHVN_00775 [Luminiphilus sp.]
MTRKQTFLKGFIVGFTKSFMLWLMAFYAIAAAYSYPVLLLVIPVTFALYHGTKIVARKVRYRRAMEHAAKIEDDIRFANARDITDMEA